MASERGGLLLDGRLAVGGLVLVDDALGGGLVELLARGHGQGLGLLGAGLGSLAELADRGLQRGLHGLVALVRSIVLPVALDLGLDVRHVRLASSVWWCWFCDSSGGVRNGPDTKGNDISGARSAQIGEPVSSSSRRAGRST